ncbi:hypothetical protein AMS68_002337 [Peltaster fructicola]|uniref:linoleate 8R-lipoxygenase n=1 Tax=Peltaster fructicola TaxID=286661 RepID=A0A6H0XQS6_9PEZI|nr:hypothetical protein AMS68_002337 [Peltaster fructicola]
MATLKRSGSRAWSFKKAPVVSVAEATPEPAPESKIDELHGRFATALVSLKKALKAIKAPVPTQTGDGTALPEAPATGIHKKAAELGDATRDCARLGIKTTAQLVDAASKMSKHELVDDREYLMEVMIKAAATIPDDSVSNKLTDGFVTTLWNDLSHPPQDLMSSDYMYRKPDGSMNNYERPMVGAAHMPYARTVASKTMQPGSLPDPGVLFDTLLARKKGTEHPNKISSMLFYIASIIIHDVFKTDHRDFRVSGTSSYLDLAPLYGSDWEQQKSMRTFNDGKIHPDCFSEPRLLSFPPGVGAILIMFNRYHNWVVEQLAAINEGHRFDKTNKKFSKHDGIERDQRDEDLFQTGRLVTCGLYINIILVDYVRVILNLNRTDSNWQLDPRKDIPNGPPKGTGNQVSAEFNLVYRWHSAISSRDEAWTDDLMDQIFQGKDTTDLDPVEVVKTLGHLQADVERHPPHERPFPALKSETLQRITDGPYKGRFKDDDLAALLTASIEDCANAMGPQQVPICLRAIEVLGIQQARTWQLATLNEFRQHFGLQPHRTFDDITKNVEVAEALKHLYDTPDHVELYPGLVVEDAKKPMLPGSGLCPSYTVSRAVLSDAVALVRGDRFYTTCYTPSALTNWGLQEASSDLAIDNGCVFYKLFLRALPNNYDPASIYVHYPLTVPSETEIILKALNKDHKYDMSKPTSIPQPTIIMSHSAAMKIMNDKETFNVTWGKAMQFLMTPAAKNFMLAGDGPANAKSRALMEKGLYQGESSRAIPKGNEKWLQAVQTFYEETTTKMLQEKSFKLGKLNQVDIIREVGNRVHVHFAAELFSLPLKTEEFPHGMLTETEMYLIFAAVFICVFFDVDPPKSFGLRQTAYDVTKILSGFIEAQVRAIYKTGKLAEDLIDRIKPVNSTLKDYGIHMIKRLCDANTDLNDLVYGNIMGTAAGMVANQGQLFGQILDYMFTEGTEHIPEINRLAKQDTPEAFDKLMHYMLEFSRLNGETGVFRRVTKHCHITDENPGFNVSSVDYNLKAGDVIMVNLKAVSRDPKAFPDPDKVRLDRDIDSYVHFGWGPHQCLGTPMTRVALTTMLKVIGRLDNLQAADVAVGKYKEQSKVKKIVKEFVPGDLEAFDKHWHYHAFMTEDWDMFFPFPTSLKVNWTS